MSRAMNHDDAYEALAAAALDALSAEEQSAVLAHAATCPQCGPELGALREALGMLGSATPPAVGAGGQDIEPRLARIKSRLMARVEADAAPARTPAPSRWIAWFALAAALVIVGILYNQNMSYRRTVAALTGPRTAVVALSPTGALEPSALMFWDRSDDRWAFYAHHLKPPAAGKTYQLWLVTPSTKISAGTFTPAADSSVELHMTYALPPNALQAVAVTEEPAGGVPQPTGPMVIAGVCRSPTCSAGTAPPPQTTPD